MGLFDEILEESVKVHGHLCPGQVIGVRLAFLGLRTIGIEPKKGILEQLFTVVEINRCPTDAIKYVTGGKAGEKTIKVVDYGDMAASFVNLENGRACRIVERAGARELSRKYCPEILDQRQQQIAAYKIIKDLELFDVQTVVVEFPEADMPSCSLKKPVKCDECGVLVHIYGGGDVNALEKCKNCLGEKYYTVIE